MIATATYPPSVTEATTTSPSPTAFTGGDVDLGLLGLGGFLLLGTLALAIARRKVTDR